jgi:type II secretory pathway component PulC
VAQTAKERARAEAARQRAEVLRQQDELLRLRELERLHREQELQQELEHRRQALEEVMAHARQEMDQAMAEARAERIQSELQAREIQARSRALREEARGVYREQLEEIRQRARDQERKIRQVVVRTRARVRLGVTLTGNQSEEMDRQGVEIQGVMEDSPAEEAGLQEGDIITHLNGQSLVAPIPDEEEEDFEDDQSLPVQRLVSLAGELDEGDEVEVRFIRDGTPQAVSFEAGEMDDRAVAVYLAGEGEEGERRVLTVRPGQAGVWTMTLPDEELVELELSELREPGKLEDLKIHLEDLRVELDELRELRELEDLHVDVPRLRIHADPEGLIRGYAIRGGEGPTVYSVLGAGTRYGLRLTELNPGLAEYFATDAGLLVLEVDEDSGLGLTAGDVILEVDGRQIEDQSDLIRILRSYEEDETVSFTVMRKGQEIVVEGRIR